MKNLTFYIWRKALSRDFWVGLFLLWRDCFGQWYLRMKSCKSIWETFSLCHQFFNSLTDGHIRPLHLQKCFHSIVWNFMQCIQDARMNEILAPLGTRSGAAAQMCTFCMCQTHIMIVASGLCPKNSWTINGTIYWLSMCGVWCTEECLK